MLLVFFISWNDLQEYDLILSVCQGKTNWFIIKFEVYSQTQMVNIRNFNWICGSMLVNGLDWW
jgi:hypothetical protein